MGGEAVAREEHVHPTAAHEAGQVGAGARVDDGRAADGQELAAAVPAPPDPVGDLADEKILGLLRRDLRRHELEGGGAPGALEGLHPHAVEPYDDVVAGPHPVHGLGADPRRVANDQRAVHLRVLDVDPVTTQANLCREVGRRVEALGKNAVGLARFEERVSGTDPVGAVQLQLGDQRRQHVFVAGDDLDAGPAGVDARSADLHVDDVIVGPGVDDGVEDLGQDERVDDVAFDLDDFGGHQGLAVSSLCWITVAVWSPLPWASPSPSPRTLVAATASCASTSTAASRAWGTSATAPARRSSATGRRTNWLAACSPTAVWKACTSIRMSSPSIWRKERRAKG